MRTSEDFHPISGVGCHRTRLVLAKAVCFSLLMFLLPSPAANGQTTEFEYGKPDELKGVRSIYVYTGAELELHDNIVKNIKQKLPDLLIASNPVDADVILVFSADAQTFFSGLSGSTTIRSDGTMDSSSSARYSTIIEGKGQVVKLVAKNRIRLLMEFSGSNSGLRIGFFSFEKRPSTNFA